MQHGFASDKISLLLSFVVLPIRLRPTTREREWDKVILVLYIGEITLIWITRERGTPIK